MKIKSLEDYIKDYLKEKATSLGTEGYADWISKNGTDPDASFNRDILRASNAYNASLATYGARAEGVANAGLTDSGYAEYIKTAAQARHKDAVSDAKADYEIAVADNASSYKSYLEKTQTEEVKLYDKVYRRLRSEKILNYEKAYERALAMGLRKIKAEEAAKKASESVRTDIKYSIARKAVEESLTRNQAYRFAIGSGLSEEDAKELGQFAFDINQSADSGDEWSDAYLDYLKELKEKQKGEQ